jgi:hypothetical protein
LLKLKLLGQLQNDEHAEALKQNYVRDVVVPMKAIDDKQSILEPKRISVESVLLQGAGKVVHNDFGRPYEERFQDGERIVSAFGVLHDMISGNTLKPID